jgi:hypothetical protein
MRIKKQSVKQTTELEIMCIAEINAMGAGIVCGGEVEMDSVIRKGPVVLCEAEGTE